MKTLKEIDNSVLDAWEKRDLLPNIQVRLYYIADDYAIEFAYWLEWCDYKAFNTYEELLEIFKKEKGL